MKQYMKKQFQACCYLMSLLFAVTLVASCSNDDEDVVVLMNPQDICGTLYAGSGTNIEWNGKNLSDCSFEFFPVEGDTTKLQLKLYGAIISEESPIVIVDVVPGESEIVFSGTKAGYQYELKVEGSYFDPLKDGEHIAKEQPAINLKCQYKAIGDLTMEQPYIFRFDKNCMYWQAGSGNMIEWDGQKYSATDFVQRTLEHISARIAKKITAIKVVFHEDASVDMSFQRAGSTEFVPWMTVQYWYSSKYSNNMYLEFTDEQVKMFYDEWLGIPDDYYSPPFMGLPANRNALPMIYWAGERLGWSIANPYRYRALDMYVRAKGIEGLTEKEKQELLLFRECLENVDDQSHWMSWCITMNSEKIEY